jgi:nucleoid-associated protein YgaU
LGLKSHKEGKYSSARRQFLIALRLWPDYPEAVKMLTSRKRTKVKRYVVHKIKPGESLSKVAKTYYGDYKKFTLIANYNNIKDVAKIEVGQEIKVPKLEG